MTPPMDRKEIETLLVFLANETLEGEEREAVEAAVAADPLLQTELKALKRIRAEMQAEDIGHSPGEFGLARLMRDIDGEQKAAQAQASVVRPRLWQGIAAAAVGLLVVQGIWTMNRDDGFDVIQAGGETEATIEGPTLIVAFSEDATEATIRQLLLELDLKIISGPSAIGLYTLVAVDEASRDTALTRLSTETAIIDSAEPGE